MIFNPLLQDILNVLQIKDTNIDLLQERELEAIVERYRLETTEVYKNGYAAGYTSADIEHEDDFDDGKNEGEECVWTYLKERLQKQLTAAEELKIDTTGDLYRAISDWLKKAKTDY